STLALRSVNKLQEACLPARYTLWSLAWISYTQLELHSRLLLSDLRFYLFPLLFVLTYTCSINVL
ncbi:hypothetical protein LX36DRAFT_727092, partial [Colletotrichum falcatum]